MVLNMPEKNNTTIDSSYSLSWAVRPNKASSAPNHTEPPMINRPRDTCFATARVMKIPVKAPIPETPTSQPVFSRAHLQYLFSEHRHQEDIGDAEQAVEERHTYKKREEGISFDEQDPI